MADRSIDVTHGRKTTVVFDDFPEWTIAPPFKLDRSAKQIGQGTADRKSNVHRLEFGWQMRAKIMDIGKVHESAEAQSGFYLASLGKATIAPNHTETNYQRQQPLPGVSYRADVPASGKTLIKKDVPAGESAEQRLSADQSSFPGPDDSEEVTDLDRVLVATTDHDPIDHVVMTWTQPDHGAAAVDVLAQFYFSGPAGQTSDFDGYGQYCARIYGDLTVKLFERGEDPAVPGSPDWKYRFWFNCGDGYGRRPHVMHVMHVFSDSVQNPDGSYSGSTLTFVSDSLLLTFSSLAENLRDDVKEYSAMSKSAPKYVVPNPGLPVHSSPVRVDVRRDVFLDFHVAKHVFPAEATLTDEPFTLDHWPVQDEILRFEVNAVRPTGTGMSAQVYDAADDSPLTQTLVLDDEFGLVYECLLNAGSRGYYAAFTFTSDTDKTATLKGTRAIDTPTTEQVAFATTTLPDYQDSGSVVALMNGTVRGFRITGPQSDPSAYNALFSADDLSGEFAPVLRLRDMVPVRIETEYDTSDHSLKSVLFSGYTAGPWAEKAGTSSVYPSPDWHSSAMTATGEWRRLQDGLAPQNFSWVDNTIGRGFRVTFIAKELMKDAGVPENRLIVPDRPIEFFGSQGDQFFIENSEPISPVVVRILKEYLGAYVLQDDNASADGGTTVGCWRVLEQKVPDASMVATWGGPYRPIARFTYGEYLGGSVDPGTVIVPVMDRALGFDTVDGHEVPILWAKKGPRERTERPEGNIVVVRGAAIDVQSGKSGRTEASMLSQVAYNVKSCNFFGLAPGDPNYPGPLNADGSPNPEYLQYPAPVKVYDATLNTEAAVNFVCRRVAEFACVSRRIREFDGPLALVWDQDDPYQVNPRPMRFYDAVQFWDPDAESWETWLVRSCDPFWDKDNVQMARYVLVRPSNIDTVAALSADKGLSPLANWIKKTLFGLGSGARVETPRGKRLGMRSTVWAGLPESPLDPIQDLDPTSPDFGKFYWMMDYDPMAA